MNAPQTAERSWHRADPQNPTANRIGLRQMAAKGLATLAVVLVLASQGQAQTTVCGSIVGKTWTKANSPYVVTCDLAVVSLTIQPGVQVIFQSNYVMEVQGWLNAVGTAAEPILFTRTNGGWQGIFFNYSPPVSQLSYCRIERGVNSGVRIAGTSVTISDCTIQNNSASGAQGGGINCDSDLILTRCVISGNSSGASGGGVRNLGALTLNGCTIASNQVASSGGAYGGGVTAGGALSLNGCTIVGNSLSGTDTYGAGAYSGASITAVDSVIADNRASAYRGNWSANCYGAGLFSSANTSLKHCQVLRNSASATTPGWGPVNYGGGIYCGGILALANSVVSSNSISTDSNPGPSPSWARGGGVFTASLVATNSIIDHNSSYAVGRGSPSDHYGMSQGAGAYLSSGSAVLNCSIAYNSATAAGSPPVAQGGGLFSAASASNQVQVINCIVWGSAPDQLYGPMTVTYSDVQNGFSGQGNIAFNPIFTAPSAGDFHLLDGSPCIDAGSPSADFYDVCFPPSLGLLRNDMGAYGGPGAGAWPGETHPDAPQIIAPPLPQSGCPGSAEIFSVTATTALNFAPLRYQWFYGVNKLTNETDSSLVLTNRQTSNSGPYSVMVSNTVAGISATAILWMYEACVDLLVDGTNRNLSISGPAGTTNTYVLKYTTNLTNTNFATWTPLATNTVGTSPWLYPDTNSPFSTPLFYGVKRQP